ncbi:MAG: hypothetical protein WD689_00940 [Gaiellaceae bacterium]
MPDPSSWKAVEPGWRVLGPGGDEVGRVHEVLGDPDADIFNGLNVTSGLLGSPEYVPAERVREIREGEIFLD